jgi:hypothetical protein
MHLKKKFLGKTTQEQKVYFEKIDSCNQWFQLIFFRFIKIIIIFHCGEIKPKNYNNIKSHQVIFILFIF